MGQSACPASLLAFAAAASIGPRTDADDLAAIQRRAEATKPEPCREPLPSEVDRWEELRGRP